MAENLTQEQETAILNLFAPPASTDGTTQIKTGNPKDDFKTKLDTLVTAGTITQDQETAVLNLFTPPTNTNELLKLNNIPLGNILI